MAGRDEQETIVTKGRTDDYVEIWTNNTVDVRALEKEPRAERISPVYPDGVAYSAERLSEHVEEGWGVTYRVPAEDFHPLKGFKRKTKPLSQEQKDALAERLRISRNQATI